MRTPLAWKNLTGDLRRLFLGAAGVGFAAVLMFMQNGFKNALTDSPVQLLGVVEGDLIAFSVVRYAMPSEQRFPRSLLDLSGGDRDVAWVAPMMVERASARVRVEERARRSIRVIALPLEQHLFRNPELAQRIDSLRQPGTAMVDDRSKTQYGFALHDIDKLHQQSVELMNKRLQLVGTFRLGTDFAHDGNLLVSPQTLANFFPFRGNGAPESLVDFGLIRLRPGSRPEEVAQRLTQLAPQQWKVMPRESLIAREVQFWEAQTPIGMIFFIGTMMGFAVGVIVCYQILYTSIHDSMSELATLKAMGYPNRYFVGLVIRQSVYLSVIGFLPALGVSWLLFRLLESIAGLPMLMTAPRIGFVFGLTLIMCVVSGLLALRKLVRADPASLF